MTFDVIDVSVTGCLNLPTSEICGSATEEALVD
jgi:hypothetical protein